MGETSRNIRSGSRTSCRRSGEARAIVGRPSKLTKEGHQEKERFWARHGRQDIDRAGLPDRTLYARGGAMLETAEMELDDGARRWGYDPRFPLTYARYGPGAGYQ